MVYETNIFHELPSPQIDGLASFSLNPLFYEKEMTKITGGTDISSHDSIKSIPEHEENILRKFIPAYSRSEKKKQWAY